MQLNLQEHERAQSFSCLCFSRHFERAILPVKCTSAARNPIANIFHNGDALHWQNEILYDVTLL
jgi:hypothetical protein